jgi:hypothetical protein
MFFKESGIDEDFLTKNQTPAGKGTLAKRSEFLKSLAPLHVIVYGRRRGAFS